MLNPITSSRPYISRWEQHLWVTRTTRAHVYTVDIWWYYTRFSLDHSYPANPDIKPWCCFSLFFFTYPGGIQCKSGPTCSFSCWTWYIYIYILSPQVSGSLTLTLNRMKTDETSLCVYGFMMIHEHGFIDLYIIIHIYIIFPAINLHLVRGFPSHLWWPVSL